jgi:hypothetical protein
LKTRRGNTAGFFHGQGTAAIFGRSGASSQSHQKHQKQY